MQEIGQVAAGARAEYADEIHRLAWLPGGKKLSFFYKDKLYVASANSKE